VVAVRGLSCIEEQSDHILVSFVTAIPVSVVQLKLLRQQ